MKTFPVAMAFGLFGAVAVMVSSSQQWPTWVMFVAWVSFYIFGKTWQSSLKALLQMSLGMAMAVLIQLSARMLSNWIGPIAFPVSVFLFIGSLAFLSKIKGLNNIPAWFLGLIILFGAHPQLEPLPVAKLIIPIIAGFVFACANNFVVEKLHARQ